MSTRAGRAGSRTASMCSGTPPVYEPRGRADFRQQHNLEREAPMKASEVTERSRLAITIALTAATVGVVYGYDTGSIAGALLFIPKDFSLSTTATEWITTFTGLGLIAGALAATVIADRFGRRAAMIIIAAGFTVFAILQGVAPGIVWLDITRLFLAVAGGIPTIGGP